MLSPFAAIQRRGLDSGRAVPLLAIVEISVVDRMVDRGPEIEIDPRGDTRDLRQPSPAAHPSTPCSSSVLSRPSQNWPSCCTRRSEWSMRCVGPRAL
jgi:hypothetical protein